MDNTNEGSIVHEGARPGEQRRVTARVDKLRAALGWTPATSFERGLAQTIEWAEHQHNRAGGKT